jgi:outer membrane protein
MKSPNANLVVVPHTLKMGFKSFYLFFILCGFLYESGKGQITINLQESINTALGNSFDTRLADVTLNQAMLEYKLFELDKRPKFQLNGTLPSFDRDNFGVLQPNGTTEFVDRIQGNSNANIGITQPLNFSGGTIALNTSLTRFDDYSLKTKRYSGSPFFLQIQQPLFGYNDWRWRKRIAPLKLLVATLQQKQSKYDITYEVVELFFNVANYQTELAIAKESYTLGETLLKNEKKKLQIGVSDNDKVLQLQIRVLEGSQEINNLNLLLEKATAEFLQFLQMPKTAYPMVEIPARIPASAYSTLQLIDSIDKNDLLETYFKMRSTEIASDRERRKKGTSSISVNMSYGLNKSGNEFSKVYQHPNQRQGLNIGVNIPIYDWGRRKYSGYYSDEQQKELVLRVEKEKQSLSKEIALSLAAITEAVIQSKSTIQLDSLTKQRVKNALKMFEAGKLTLIELQSAESEAARYQRLTFGLVKQYFLALHKLQQLCVCNLQARL